MAAIVMTLLPHVVMSRADLLRRQKCSRDPPSVRGVETTSVPQ